jgi:hypothetical protein
MKENPQIPFLIRLLRLCGECLALSGSSLAQSLPAQAGSWVSGFSSKNLSFDRKFIILGVRYPAIIGGGIKGAVNEVPDSAGGRGGLGAASGPVVP